MQWTPRKAQCGPWAAAFGLIQLLGRTKGPSSPGLTPGSVPEAATGTLDIQRSADAGTTDSSGPLPGRRTVPEQGNRPHVYLIQARAPPSMWEGWEGPGSLGKQMTWGRQDLILSPRALFAGAWMQGQPGVPGPGRTSLQAAISIPRGTHPAWPAPDPGNPHETCYL